MTIKKIKITKINPAPYNPRKDLQPNDPEYQKLKKSIEKFGLVEPLVWNQKTGNLVGGHQRLKILQDRGDQAVSVSVVNLDDADEKALNIALNKISGEWDEDKLSELLKELQELQELPELPDFDIELTGFDLDEITNLQPQKPAEEDNFNTGGALDAIDEPITKLGDIIILGRHRLMCGDSTKMEDVELLMDGKKADMVFTDPPYGVSIVRNGSIGGDKPFGTGKNGFDGVIKAGEYSPIIGDDTINTALAAYEICASMKINPIIFWGGNYYAHKLPPASCWVIWDKQTDGKFGDGEVAWCNAKKSIRIFRHKWSGMIKASERNKKRVHPTQKPIALAEWGYTEFGHNKDIVLDLFVGSGWTIIAAEQLDRICYGMELDPKYCDVIVKRWEEFTGQKAIRP